VVWAGTVVPQLVTSIWAALAETAENAEQRIENANASRGERKVVFVMLQRLRPRDDSTAITVIAREKKGIAMGPRMRSVWRLEMMDRDFAADASPVVP
jgi:hypothetical protein